MEEVEKVSTTRVLERDYLEEVRIQSKSTKEALGIDSTMKFVS